MTVFVDRLQLNRNVIAEAHLAARRLAAQPVLALAENPEIAADRRHRYHPLHEDFIELDEKAERGNARDGARELLANLVAHEDDFFPLQHFARGVVGAPLAVARLRGVQRMGAL